MCALPLCNVHSNTANIKQKEQWESQGANEMEVMSFVANEVEIMSLVANEKPLMSLNMRNDSNMPEHETIGDYKLRTCLSMTSFLIESKKGFSTLYSTKTMINLISLSQPELQGHHSNCVKANTIALTPQFYPVL